ncbi:MAG: FAD-dependent oxidoreductase, partial [Pseudomonadota bacterium]
GQRTDTSATRAAEPSADLRYGCGTWAVIVIGAGPVGMRVVEQLLEKGVPASEILQLGGEAYEPYNRVKLSSLLAGETNLAGIAQPSFAGIDAGRTRLGCTVVGVDRSRCTVTDREGNVYGYRRLVLATGSTPKLPEISGINKKGVYTFRDLSDAYQLAARKIRSRHTVVLGGGLLGLEAARAMAQFNTQVTVIEWSSILMVRQLDDRASALLQKKLAALGIRCLTGQTVVEVNGRHALSGVTLRGGGTITCDTVVVATGINPNIDLARSAGLSVGKGVRVNNQLQTNDPSIYAVGECCEYNGTIYGLLAPGLEHADVAANAVSRSLGALPVSSVGAYSGSVTATNLKVAGVDVCSFGRTGHEEPESQLQKLVFDDEELGVYRKLFLFRGRLVGAISIGSWPEVSRVRQASRQSVHLYPWQRWQFKNSGQLWGADNARDVSNWRSGEVVCQCMGVSKGQLTSAMGTENCSVDQLRLETGAASVCGSCEPLLQALVGGNASPTKDNASTTLASIGFVCLVFCILVFVSPPLPYASSVQSAFSIDWLWRDSYYKQVTGFGLLLVSVLLATISLRKRVDDFKSGTYGGWRIAHVLSAVVVIALLLAHTGLRAGSNLNLILMICFTGLIGAGALAGIAVGIQHRLSPSTVRVIKQQSLFWHVLLLIPLPAVLGFHVLKTYWF